MGRHSAPDDYDDNAAAVLSAPPAPTGRPRPGRHSDGAPSSPQSSSSAEAPRGLDVIETAMGTETADTDTDTDGDAAGDLAAESHTAQIEPIVDPVLDEPLPVAVTTLIPPVTDGQTPPPRPAPRLDPQAESAAPTSTDDRPADQPAEPDDQPDEHARAEADKQAAEAEKRAAKAEKQAAKAEKQAAKADKAAARQTAKEQKDADKRAAKQAAAGDHPGEPPRPQPRVSDLALLRSDSAARARVIAAVVVPFLLYFVVLLVLDTLDLRTVLIWIWLPLITAGIVAGLLLDLAHRAAAARAITTAGQVDEAADQEHAQADGS